MYNNKVKTNWCNVTVASTNMFVSLNGKWETGSLLRHEVDKTTYVNLMVAIEENSEDD